jgi:hypothetical protein
MTHESGSKQVVNLLDEAVSFIDDEREASANGFDDGGYGASHNPAPECGGDCADNSDSKRDLELGGKSPKKHKKSRILAQLEKVLQGALAFEATRNTLKASRLERGAALVALDRALLSEKRTGGFQPKRSLRARVRALQKARDDIKKSSKAFDTAQNKALEALRFVKSHGMSALSFKNDLARLRQDVAEREAQEIEENNKPPPEPRSFGYDIDLLNEQYSLVLLGSKAVVFMDQPKAPVDDQQRVLKIEAFNAWFSNKFTEVLSGDKLKVITWAQAWMQSSKRRSYKGIEFFPDPKSCEGMKDYLNLWSGFAFEPKQKKDKSCGYSVFKDHLIHNVCNGNMKHFEWLFGFFSHIVQYPRERIGVALVMRGLQGTGKTTVGEVFGSLFPRHFFLVDDPRYVTGQFNAHMASCLLLQAEEAVWAGDKAAEGRLKGLITSPIQQIEAKGVDPIRLKNYVRIIMTSNNDWVVPAGKDERRFAVFDVHPRCAQNHGYFKEMYDELNHGGREALLYDMLHYDLSKVNMREIPRTAALLEQKIRSFDSIESWWYQCLLRGSQLRTEDDWHINMTCSKIIDDYILESDRIGVKRKAAETEVGMKLTKLIPRLEKVRTYDTSLSRRTWQWVFPPLEECRQDFTNALQQDVVWPQV